MAPVTGGIPPTYDVLSVGPPHNPGPPDITRHLRDAQSPVNITKSLDHPDPRAPYKAARPPRVSRFMALRPMGAAVLQGAWTNLHAVIVRGGSPDFITQATARETMVPPVYFSPIDYESPHTYDCTLPRLNEVP